jgi:hypothetical protein
MRTRSASAVAAVSFLTAALLSAGMQTAAAAPETATSTLDASVDGGAWSIVPSPNVGEVDNGLSDLAVVSATDIWAVGNRGTYGEPRSTLALHWNGSAWSVASTPNGRNEVNWLIGADAAASDDVWAVGYSATNPPETSRSRTLIEHFDGTRWTVVPSPNPAPSPPFVGPVSNELYDVDAVADNDVWAVGRTFDLSSSRALVQHWDGSAWTVVPSPHPGRYSILRSVSAVAADDVWAVGTKVVHGLQVTFAAHWDGSRWTEVPMPNDGPFVQELFQVRAVASNDVWAVGYHLALFGANQVFQTTILHWDGAAWSVVPSPDQTQLNNYLFSVDGISASDAWAVGFYDNGFQLRTMTQHWDGTAWSIVPSPNGSDVIDELVDVAALSADDVWAVGQSAGFFTFETLTIHLSPT